jgi:very-short-patch-repair endonuclease
LRKNQTHPELNLGKALKEKFPNTPIYRQSICYGYILDFYVAANKPNAPYKGLAIEVDGPHHLLQLQYDMKRDFNLKSKGIKTLRFNLGMLKVNMAACLALIQKEIKKIRD